MPESPKDLNTKETEPIIDDANVVQAGAEIAKPMIDGVPKELGGEQVRAETEADQAARAAAMEEHDKKEISLGASTVKSVVPPQHQTAEPIGEQALEGPAEPHQPGQA